MKADKIAILGATSHIARGLIYNFSRTKNYKLFLFARSRERLTEFQNSIECTPVLSAADFGNFMAHKYDIIINCIGIGDPAKLKKSRIEIYQLNEQFDNLVLEYLSLHPKALYIYFSSGVAYGNDFMEPAEEKTRSTWNINNISQSDFYGITKLYTEAKHRSFNHLNIVDIRIFAYFSRFIDLSSRYFITDVIAALKSKEQFVTNRNNIMRDYIYPDDLFSLVCKCIEQPGLNDVFDAYSLKPISKFEILDYFSRKYGLESVFQEDTDVFSVTGSKDNYYSKNKRAEKIGYYPRYTSLYAIMKETELIWQNRTGA